MRSPQMDRDPLTGEYIDGDPDRYVDWSEDPMLGRWATLQAQYDDPWTALFGKVK